MMELTEDQKRARVSELAREAVLDIQRYALANWPEFSAWIAAGLPEIASRGYFASTSWGVLKTENRGSSEAGGRSSDHYAPTIAVLDAFLKKFEENRVP